jgi:CRP/FNR family transcriptional regulator, cyclic AMP receptor protein
MAHVSPLQVIECSTLLAPVNLNLPMVHIALITTLLGRTDLFGSLSEADRTMVARKMRELRYQPGQQIFARGDAANGIHLVIDGRVRLSVLSADGRVLSFNHASVGAIFGEIATLDGGSRTADATALTMVRTMLLERPHLLQLIESKPNAARAAIAFVCARLRVTSEQVEAIALHPIEVRLARFLLTAITLGKTQVGKTGRASLDLGTSQTELALLLGASRQKVNAALAELEERGAVKRAGSRRMDCSVPTLESIADAK